MTEFLSRCNNSRIMWMRLMISEQELLKKWGSLTQDKQKQVLDFMDFLYWQDINSKPGLEKRLQQIRNKVIEQSIPLYGNSNVVNDQIP
ncbi:hypothetical protein [Nostoc sp. CENA543]|uniref:hypothetical protein n=1 Tax=Nostoc sp. CENA543 TaxID=1869241 RepID=UPI001CEF58B0|nr:hypothetical protein [Nostoc sp. CENA543]